MKALTKSSGALPAISLPSVSKLTTPLLEALTSALGIPRDVLATDEQIDDAWDRLPKLLGKIPPEHRNERMARMCVAVATGLFDSAINYAWNAAVVALRDKVRVFGLTVIPQVIGRSFDEAALVDLKDADLLDLCLKLNLISEEGFFVLDQCRDIRNNFSAAHPSMGAIDEHEFIAFLNRCAKHALASERNPKGVDIQALIKALKATRFSAPQIDEWCARLNETFDAQRDLLFSMLHGIYCDPSSGEEGRVNALAIFLPFADRLTPKAQSSLVDQHQDYRAKGDEPRYKASLQFFEKLKLQSLLNSAEVHSIITTASRALMSVHNAFDNFHNEPPFAERLASLAAQHQIPESAQTQFVETVVTCAVGNRYGTSNSAMASYARMIRSRVSTRPFWPGHETDWKRYPSDSINVRIENHQRGLVGSIQFYNLLTYELLLIEHYAISPAAEVAYRFTRGHEPIRGYRDVVPGLSAVEDYVFQLADIRKASSSTTQTS